MATDAPWFRQNADWMLTRWLDELGYPYAGIWNWLLGHVKCQGNGRGQCKSIPLATFARMHGLPLADVERFFEAAIMAGAVEDDGKRWTLTGWAEYQSPDAERMRKNRSEQEAIVTDKPDLLRTNGECSNTVTRQDKTVQDNTESTYPKPLSGLSDFRKVIEAAWKGDYTDAWSFNLLVRRLSKEAGFAFEPELDVPERGDGHAGKVDLYLTGAETIAVELDRSGPRVKSIIKLQEANAVHRVVVLRNATRRLNGVDRDEGGVLIWHKPLLPGTPQPFSRPKPDDVATYFREIGVSMDEARKFWDYYESNGWKVGKNSMKNWQAAARNWKRNVKSEASGRTLDSMVADMMRGSQWEQPTTDIVQR